MLANQSLPVKGGLWKDICQLNINEQRVRDKIVNGLAMEVGNGRKTRFWEDNWVQGGSLRVHFPRLFSVSSQQNFVIGDCGFWDGLEWIWNFQWRRELFQWELELVHQLHERLRPVRMSLENEDAVVWKFDNTGVFSTKSFLQIIQTETLSEEITSYSFTRAIWKGLVPPRIELFGWFVLVGRINTKERLNRLGVDIHSDTICVLCHKGVENIEHLFLRCEVTWQVWCYWLRFFSSVWVIPGTMRDLFGSWIGMLGRRQG
ncbi:uncharacterized protein [Arachis hypogaea]|uniref:uncharacterized protein n=1 Tax=Arachis hypogaea TaxID=3818 RepID=UPI003B2135EA